MTVNSGKKCAEGAVELLAMTMAFKRVVIASVGLQASLTELRSDREAIPLPSPGMTFDARCLYDKIGLNKLGYPLSKRVP